MPVLMWVTSKLSPDDDNSTFHVCIYTINKNFFFTFSAIPNISKHSIIQLCGIMPDAFR